MIPFLPIRLFFSLFWFAWGICSLSRIAQSSVLAKNRFRSLIFFITIFTGPIVELILMFIECRGFAAVASLEKRRSKCVKMEKDMELSDSQGKTVFSGTSAEDGPHFQYVKHILSDAILRRASDIFINPVGDASYSIRYRQDGALHEVDQISAKEAAGAMSIVKVASSMDIAEHRRPQDGAFAANTPEGKISFRVATVGSYGGEKMAIRLLGSVGGARTLQDIGMSAANLKIMQESVRYPSGLVLLCGPTGSGKTSTLYALIQAIDYSIKNVISIEDPIESEMPKVSQMEVNNHAGITFAALLRNALRQNPDIICVGEIRDEETAGIAVQAAQTGHLIIATIHSNDNLGTLDRLKTLGLPFRTVAETLRVIISQRLVRTLCPHCKKKIELSQSMKNYFKAVGFRDDNVYKAVGCPKCHMTGYQGRHAVFDIMVLSSRLRQVLESDSANLASIRAAVEEEYGSSLLAYDGYRLVAEGITSLDEVARVAVKEG